jgi:hypothetical protein
MKPIVTINIAPIRRILNNAKPYVYLFAYSACVALFVLNLRIVFRVAIETLKFFFN